ncbi:MAG TPA: DMT family transporter [Negativicutes bacterium]
MNVTKESQTTQRYPIHLTSTVTAILIWSISFVATKIALTTFPPLGLGFVRFGLATVLFGTFMIVRRSIDKPTPNDFMKLILSGLLGITVYFSLENSGVKYSTATDGEKYHQVLQ